MDSENVRFVTEAFAAFQRRDEPWLTAHTADDVEVVMPPEVPDARRYRGRDGLLDAIRNWDAQWTVVKVDPLETLEPAPGQVLLGTLQHLEVRGVLVDQEVWNLFTVRDGRTQRWQLFLTREQALAAAG